MPKPRSMLAPSILKLPPNNSRFAVTKYMSLMCKTSRRQMSKRNRDQEKNQRSQSQWGRKKKSEAGNNVPQRNQNIPIRTEFEVSPQFFWAQCSKRWPSALHFRSNIEPNYQITYEVSRSGPQTWNIALKREHWREQGKEKRSASGFFHRYLVN